MRVGHQHGDDIDDREGRRTSRSSVSVEGGGHHGESQAEPS